MMASADFREILSREFTKSGEIEVMFCLLIVEGFLYFPSPYPSERTGVFFIKALWYL